MLKQNDINARVLRFAKDLQDSCIVECCVVIPVLKSLEIQVAVEICRSVLSYGPIIIVGEDSDVSKAFALGCEGACDYLEWPMSTEMMLQSMVRAWVAWESRFTVERRRASVRKKLHMLTSREIDILFAILNGKSNKKISIDLGISVKTVEFHKANVRYKMNVTSTCELLSLCIDVELFSGYIASNQEGRLLC